jgi:hypothetical protein
MNEQIHCKPGDILEYRCPRFGVVWQWRVLSVCLGAERQEGLIEMASIMAQPGISHEGPHMTTWVPEPLTRGLTVFRPERIET